MSGNLKQLTRKITSIEVLLKKSRIPQTPSYEDPLASNKTLKEERDSLLITIRLLTEDEEGKKEDRGDKAEGGWKKS